MMYVIPQNQESQRPIENYCANYLTNWTPDENDNIIMFYALKILLGLPVVGTVYIASFIWNRITDLVCASDEIRKTNSASEVIKSNTQLESSTQNVDSIESLSGTEELKAPGYKVIEPNKDGRQPHKYLFNNRYALEEEYKPKSEYGYRGHDKITKAKYENLLKDLLEYKEFTKRGLYCYDDDGEKCKKGWEGEQYMADYPHYYINEKTTPTEFYKECAKRPTYQLHHGDQQIGFNALTISASRGNLKLLEELLNVAPELVNLEDRDGRTPLFFACLYNDKKVALEMAKLLIEKGANVNLPCFYDFSENEFSVEKNSTPLAIAAKRGNEEQVQLLLSHGAIIRTKKPVEIKSYDEEFNDYRILKIPPEDFPEFYGLMKINVDFINSQVRSLVEKKVLPLMNWGYSENIPMDILGRVVQIFLYQLKYY